MRLMVQGMDNQYFKSINLDVLCKLDNNSDPSPFFHYHFSINEPLEITFCILEIKVGLIHDFSLLGAILAYEENASNDF